MTDAQDLAKTAVSSATADLFPARIAGPGADAQSFLVRRDGEATDLRARTADSCLIRPQPEDLVLCAAYPSGNGMAFYILSVLVRADVSQPAMLAVAGGLTVSAQDGPVTVQAGQSLNLLSGTGMTLSAETLSVRAEAGLLHLDSAVLESQDAVASIGTLRLIGEKLLSLVKVVSGQHRRATRKVEEVDQVQAGEVVVAGERLITNTAHQIVHVSTEDMRFDGARIHMG
ncbi:DUF3540 domain-containing protein [Marinibaculum pumilum]|uniref:DUF3540 domain-containing protein n=1 Tax=Marinibaculum pumilum TaxID=1766165 RepID=A0ABV7L5G1_9PROT